MEIAILLAAAVLGQFVQTTTGFGFAIVVMAVCSSFFEVPELASMCPLLCILSSGYLALRYRKHLKVQVLLWPLLAFIVTDLLAVLLNRVVNTTHLKGYLGVVLVAMSLFFLLLRERISVKTNPKNGLLAGGLGGILAGLFSTGGPPISIYLVSGLEEKESYLAAIQAYFFCSNAINILFRASAGLYSLRVLKLAAIGLAGMLLGLLIGRRVVDRIRIGLMRTLTYGFIGLSGLWLIVKGFFL